jgi:hypothetical protein
MATDKSTTLTPTEITALASRLRARADSVLLRDQPEQQSDMQTAARLIEHLVHLHAEVRTARRRPRTVPSRASSTLWEDNNHVRPPAP